MSQQQAGFAFVMLGTIFLFVGVLSCGIALSRRGADRKVLGWFGIFSAMYGVRLFAGVPAAFRLLVGPIASHAQQIAWILTFVIMIPGLLFWAELSIGALRRFFLLEMVPAAVVAVGGIASLLYQQTPSRQWTAGNTIVVLSSLTVFGIATLVPQIAKKYMVVQSVAMGIGTAVFAAVVIHDNMRTFFQLNYYPFLEPLALALLVLTQGWVAAEKVATDERRLVSIEKELAMAREIQASILPAAVPGLRALKVFAAYHPMSAVAGDFYHFIPVDAHRVGVLVADVSGHGVPAALIAAMMKMAVQSVVPFADSPANVLQGLNRMFFGQAPDQFVTAAYLFMDTQNHKARYSAAGHPPLLLSRGGTLHRIESNGLVFGVTPQPDYPVRDISICPGDRFLLYTDGVIEPENAKGKAFGDSKLEQVILDTQMHSPSDLADRLLTEIRSWQPASMNQQDDITLVVIDVSAGPD
jgi:sigma-B regulation protein RsbU (phosphoserine phosphatase)